jgi:hypothetical protein
MPPPPYKYRKYPELLRKLLIKSPGLTHAEITSHFSDEFSDNFDVRGSLKYLMAFKLVRYEGGDGQIPAHWFIETERNEREPEAIKPDEDSTSNHTNTP